MRPFNPPTPFELFKTWLAEERRLAFEAGARAVLERWEAALGRPDLGTALVGERYGTLKELSAEEFIERAWAAKNTP